MVVATSALKSYTRVEIEVDSSRELCWATGDDPLSLQNCHARRVARLPRFSNKLETFRPLFSGQRSPKNNFTRLFQPLRERRQLRDSFLVTSSFKKQKNAFQKSERNKFIKRTNSNTLATSFMFCLFFCCCYLRFMYFLIIFFTLFFIKYFYIIFM